MKLRKDEIQPQGQLNHPLLTGVTPVGLMSAEKPLYPDSIPEEIRGKDPHALLGAELSQRGYQFQATHGRYGADENSYVIYGIPHGELRELGKKYGQEVVVHSENGKHRLIYTNGDSEGAFHPDTPETRVSPVAPHDNFTYIPGAGYVSIGFDFGKMHPMPHDELSKSIDLPTALATLAKTIRERVSNYENELVEMRKREDGYRNLTKSRKSEETPLNKGWKGGVAGVALASAGLMGAGSMEPSDGFDHNARSAQIAQTRSAVDSNLAWKPGNVHTLDAGNHGTFTLHPNGYVTHTSNGTSQTSEMAYQSPEQAMSFVRSKLRAQRGARDWADHYLEAGVARTPEASARTDRETPLAPMMGKSEVAKGTKLPSQKTNPKSHGNGDLSKAGPPMAKPPGSPSTPAAPPASKPTAAPKPMASPSPSAAPKMAAPKMAAPMAKAALPGTLRGDAVSAAFNASKAAKPALPGRNVGSLELEGEPGPSGLSLDRKKKTFATGTGRWNDHDLGVGGFPAAPTEPASAPVSKAPMAQMSNVTSGPASRPGIFGLLSAKMLGKTETK